MKIELLTTYAAFEDMERFAALAALTCHDNVARMDVKGYKPSDTLKNIIKFGHESILEHINLTFSVKELSRACLQELARHRHISLSVESTRHTLKKNVLPAILTSVDIYFPSIVDADLTELILDYFQDIENYVKAHSDISNDVLKYAIPECFTTNLILTTNIRELRHILELRTAPAALEEFQNLARGLFEAVPAEFRYLLEDCVYKKGDNEV